MSEYSHVIAGSGGNDSRELVRWCVENRQKFGIEQPIVVYIDTGWEWRSWSKEREWFHAWVRSQNIPLVVLGPGNMEEVIEQYGYHSPPLRKAPFCSHRLKRWVLLEWLEGWDHTCESVQVRGIRRQESRNRSDAPEFVEGTGPVDWRAITDKTERLRAAENQRDFWCPLVRLTREERDERLKAARLPIFQGPDGSDRRSRECICINSSKVDIRELSPEDIARIRELEYRQTIKRQEQGKVGVFSFFVPSEHGGAVGIDEVVRWANTDRGSKYVAGQMSFCDAGLCGS